MRDVMNLVRKAVPACVHMALHQWPGQRYHNPHPAEGLEARAGPGSEPAARPALLHQAALLQKENLEPADSDAQNLTVRGKVSLPALRSRASRTSWK